MRLALFQKLLTPEGIVVAAVTLALTLLICRPRNQRSTTTNPSSAADQGLMQKFRASMELTYERWHEGIGYDLTLLQAATPEERAAIETIVLNEPILDWRPVEALCVLRTPRCIEKLRSTLATSKDHEVTMAITQYAGDLISNEQRFSAMISALQEAPLIKGLSAALQQIPSFHPPAIMEQLHHATLHREGESAIHCAAMLLFLHRKAASIFDNAHMAFLTRFCLKAPGERAAAYEELCRRIADSK